VKLLDFAPMGLLSSLEEDVRAVMRAEGAADLSSGACRAWVRAFIQNRVPGWRRGQALNWEDAQRVGRAFEVRLVRAVPLPKKPRRGQARA